MTFVRRTGSSLPRYREEHIVHDNGEPFMLLGANYDGHLLSAYIYNCDYNIWRTRHLKKSLKVRLGYQKSGLVVQLS
jgi:hypothetical protein